MPSFNLTGLLISIPAILLALTLHEYAHARVATALGDPTPGNQGRLTLNPLAHLDPMGTILLIIAHFGWAKPVQINPFYFRGNRRQGMILVSLAGPLMNLVVAYLAIWALKLLGSTNYGELLLFLWVLAQYNVILAVFNLIPVPPLDGSQVLTNLLPPQWAGFIRGIETYGLLILMLLVLTGVMGKILWPLVDVVLNLFRLAVGV